MKRIKLFCLCCTMLLAFAFVGCGKVEVPNVIDKPTITVDENNVITSYIIGVFDKEYYTIPDLTKFVNDEVSNYNTEHPGAGVLVKKVDLVKEGSNDVVVGYEFKQASSYADFFDEDMFFGTVGEAKAAGLLTDINFKSTKDQTLLLSRDLDSVKDHKIMITKAKVMIYCPTKAAYLSEGVLDNKDGGIDTTGVDGTAYIILK